MSFSGQHRVVVTGVGLIDPFGDDTPFFSHLMRGDSATRLSRFSLQPPHEPFTQPTVQCRGFVPETMLGKAISSMTDRYSQLGIAAAFSAWQDAGFERGQSMPDNAGVSWGTGGGGVLTVDKGYSDFYERGKPRPSPLSVVFTMNNAAAAHIAIALGLGGACLTHSVACASSAISIGEAFRRIRSGEAPIMVAGGSEAPLSPAMMRAWEAMRVIAPAANEDEAGCACRPFHSARSGFVLGEGGAALVLEEREHAVRRGARIYCELAGYGQSCDHTHIVRPDANGQARAIRNALHDASLHPEEIGYVNAHGTATQEGDPVEISALKTVFGEHARRLPVSASKSMHGHLLGAAGAIEALVTVLALSRQEIPPTAHLDDIAPACTGVLHVTGEGIGDQRFDAAMSSSFAFGGSNAVLVFRRHHAF